MDEIIRFEGRELTDLLDRFRSLADQDQTGQVWSLEVCVDGGLKFKVNNATWTPPLGTVK